MNIIPGYFDGKTVLIFGLGTNGGGAGTLDFLLGTQVNSIIVTDQKSETDFLAAGATLPSDPRITWRLGECQESDFVNADIVIKNPSIRWDNPLLQAAQENGAEVIMDSTIFLALCPAPIIGVTGSKGKTTTASLIAHILTVAGHKVVPVGISQTGVLSELPKVTADSVVVFEFSSWRLSGLKSIAKSPHISVLTNLYPDHLNYYQSMEAYAEDKKIITQFQTTEDSFILPQENEWAEFFKMGTQAKIQTFGQDNTTNAWQDQENLWVWWQTSDTEPTLLLEKKMSLISGEHFFSNMLAASLAAQSFGVSLNDIQEGLKTFTGVRHRFELVREVSGVQYINDTAATIPSAALASVRSVVTPVVLLAGGSDKELPLDELLLAIEKSKAAILFAGSGTDKLLAALSQDMRNKVSIANSMAEAIAKASEVAVAGDTVLLAPGAASFGMFKNEFDRGEQFVASVNNL